MSTEIVVFQICIFTCLGFCIGFGCKAYICDDGSDQRISAIEEDLENVMEENASNRVRSREYINSIRNYHEVVAVPVSATAPPAPISYDDSNSQNESDVNNV